MKKSLLCILWTVIHLIYGTLYPIVAQTVLFSEDFSGFSTGSHITPSTADASESLDSKTSIAGWSGSRIYPACGEIKIGTSSSTGWIETPLIDLSLSNGNFTIKFDIARWPNDATTVQVYLNDVEKGEILTPSDNFETVQIICNEDQTSAKIMIKGLTKRFFIDNLMVLTDFIYTNILDQTSSIDKPKIFPVPVSSELVISSFSNFDLIEILDYTGKSILNIYPDNQNELRINVQNLKDGIYFIRFRSGNINTIRKFIKVN
jgi:hypothetical protein